jgi:nucleotide-binding universal stress UspA family protein
VLEAAAKHLQTHQRYATIVTKTVEGMPKDEILREAAAWGADRIVLGSHGRGRVRRAILGSTAAGVAAEAPCTVEIARPRRAASPGGGRTERGVTGTRDQSGSLADDPAPHSES